MLKEYPTFILKNNLKIQLRTNSTDIHAFTNVWIWEEYEYAKKHTNRNDVIIDIGAHIGLFSLYISQICDNGKIFSFEPSKSNFELLSHNVELNKLANIKIFRKAVSNKTGILHLNLDSDSAAHSIYLKSRMYEEVESTTLKEILDENKIEICHLLKLDCEGSEYDILNSLPDTYFQRIRHIMMEYHLINERPELIKNLRNRLLTLSYEIMLDKVYDNSGILFAAKIKTSNNIDTK